MQLWKIGRDRLRGPLRVMLIIAGWGVMTSAVVLAFVFQGYLVPGLVSSYRPPQDYIYLAYLLVLLVAVASGMMFADLGHAVIAFFASQMVAATLEFIVLTLPSTIGQVDASLLLGAGLAPVPDMALTIVFYSLFPVVTLLGFAGSLIGAAMGETYLD
jgi:hypothetical protein